MKNNPVYRRETTVRARSFRIPFILMMFNSILALAAFLNMYQTVAQAKVSATIQYTSFLQLYSFVAILEFLLLLFIMPALTSGSISGERERQTLELLFTTKMRPADIIIGKLFSAVMQLMILVFSSLPVVFLCFVYGSVDFLDLGLLFVCFVVSAFFSGGIGIFFSALLRRSTFSNVCTYGLILAIVVGSYMVNLFVFNMSDMQISTMVLPIGEARPAADTGAAAYLLLLNPVATFAEILESQAAGAADMLSARKFLGSHTGSFLARYWIPVSLAVQSFCAAFFIRMAITCLNPVKNEKK